MLVELHHLGKLYQIDDIERIMSFFFTNLTSQYYTIAIMDLLGVTKAVVGSRLLGWKPLP